MTVEAQINKITATLNAQTTTLTAMTNTLTALLTAVAAIPTAPGSTPVDLTALTTAVNGIAAGVADIQKQLEVDDSAPVTAPASSGAGASA